MMVDEDSCSMVVNVPPILPTRPRDTPAAHTSPPDASRAVRAGPPVPHASSSILHGHHPLFRPGRSRTDCPISMAGQLGAHSSTSGVTIVSESDAGPSEHPTKPTSPAPPRHSRRPEEPDLDRMIRNQPWYRALKALGGTPSDAPGSLKGKRQPRNRDCR